MSAPASEKIQTLTIGSGTRVITIENAKLKREMAELDVTSPLDVRDIGTGAPLAYFLPGKWDYVVRGEHEKIKEPTQEDLSDKEIAEDRALMYGAVT